MSKKNIKPQPPKNPKAKPQKLNKTQHSTFKTQNYIYLALIIIITIASYSSSFKNDFIRSYDDKEFIIDNPYIKNLSFESVKTIFATPHWSANYIPLTTLTWAIEFNKFGLNPKPYIINNIILHLLNICLVFWLIFLLTKRHEAAIISALLFALHPMHVESVTWISERKDVLYTFFYLASLIAYIKYISKPKLSIINYALSISLFVFSAFAKSAAITLPIVFILIDYLNNRKFSIKQLAEKIPFFAVSLGIGIAAIQAQKSVGAINLLYDFNFIDKIFLFTYSLMYYIIRFIAPYNFAIIHFYPVKSGGLLPWEYYVSPLFLAALVFIAFRAGKLKKDILFGLAFFFVGLLLVLQFIPLGPSVVSERYTYIPYIGFGYIISQAYCKLQTPNFKLQTYFFGALTILCAFFIISTYNVNKVWKDSVSLFTNLVEKYPNSDMANYDAGYAKMQIGTEQKDPANPAAFTDEANKNFIEALKYFDKTLSINNKYTTAYVSRGLAKHYLKQYKEEIPDYTEAIKLDSRYFEAYNNRGTAKAMLQDYAGAIPDYTKALEIKYDYSTNVNRGNAYLLLPDYPKAIENYDICIQNNPRDPVVFYNRASAKYNIQKKASACEDWQIAAQLGYTQANEKLKQYCK